jgi:3-methyladenine DNA glycosylase AlkD
MSRSRAPVLDIRLIARWRPRYRIPMPDADPATSLTASDYLERLAALRSDVEQAKIQRYFKSRDEEPDREDEFIGVPMGRVFALSETFKAMPLHEIESLLESPVHEARAGAVKIMAKQATDKRATQDHRRALYDLYLRRMDRIDDWDLVDLGAWDVVGRYLLDRPRDILYELAGSADRWERRTAMLATLAFVRHGQLDDTFGLAERLVDDPEDLVQKPVGACLREAGKQDRPRLLAFLDAHAATMPRTALRFAIERLDASTRAHYLGLRGAGASSP